MDKKYPIAEVFSSPQGEGMYCGTLMTFIRLAGCSVGKRLSEAERIEWAQKDPDFNAKGLPIYTEKCTLYDGREFLCDTDFRTHQIMTVPEILSQVPDYIKHVCLTGGEPLNHPLDQLLDALRGAKKTVHIETSGTVNIMQSYTQLHDMETILPWLWLTVSPKKGALDFMIEAADEIKLLVDEGFDIAKVPEAVKKHQLVFISAVNNEFTLDPANVQKCLAIQRENPTFRIAIQAHKVLNVR